MNKRKNIIKARYFSPKELKLFDYVFLALLVALNIVLERFLGFVSGEVAFSISFIAIVFAALSYGPIGAITVSVLGDFIGTFLSGLAINPLFCITAAVQGLIYGLALGRRDKKYRLSLSFLTIIPAQIICTLLLNSLFLSISYYGIEQFFRVMSLRLLQFSVNIPLQIILTHFFAGYAYPRIKKAIK